MYVTGVTAIHNVTGITDKRNVTGLTAICNVTRVTATRSAGIDGEIHDDPMAVAT